MKKSSNVVLITYLKFISELENRNMYFTDAVLNQLLTSGNIQAFLSNQVAKDVKKQQLEDYAKISENDEEDEEEDEVLFDEND